MRQDGPLQPSADAYKESDLLQSADHIKNLNSEDVSEYLVETGDEEPGDLSPTAPEAADDFQDVILEESTDDKDGERDVVLLEENADLSYDLMDNNDDAAFADDDEAALAFLDQQAANEDSFLMLESEMLMDAQLDLEDEVDHSSEFFSAADSGMDALGVSYTRVLPDQYGEDTQNKFMKIILTDFALEQKTAEGKPSGVFKMDKK
jgi:hypothetical protein